MIKPVCVCACSLLFAKLCGCRYRFLLACRSSLSLLLCLSFLMGESVISVLSLSLCRRLHTFPPGFFQKENAGRTDTRKGTACNASLLLSAAVCPLCLESVFSFLLERRGERPWCCACARAPEVRDGSAFICQSLMCSRTFSSGWR